MTIEKAGGVSSVAAAGRVASAGDVKALGIINAARAHLGYAEGPNNQNKFTQRVMGDANQPWCAAFVTSVLQDAGMKTVPGSASSRALAGQFQDRGLYSPRGAKPPQPGDVIFFGARGSEHHVGIVQKVENGKVYTIEGNSSDKVSQRVYSLDDPGIGGYGRPVEGPVSNDLGVDTSQASTGRAGGTPSSRQSGRGTATSATSTGVDALSYVNSSNWVLKAIIESILNDNVQGLSASLGERYPYVSEEDLADVAKVLKENPELAAKIAANPEMLDRLVADHSPEAVKKLLDEPAKSEPSAESRALARDLLSSENFSNRDAAMAQLAPFLKANASGGWNAGTSVASSTGRGWVR